ncbi:EPIDERMAL PATTERNING FACTOR-like protein 8 [Prunus yedoensis var. nudiflora]|uniref:Epidermal patterning factor-like protein n=1 Tax=Prunus yedoensis var. nudiflora TaxID=2094558 RepID=A0A314YYG1_PRUYE|nr:EPIDERMAL PATTERNING FACTOR-like protein 8 [Prunus yedoensis var. nudiflora]
MAPASRSYHVHGLKVAIITVASIFLLTILLPNTVDSLHSSNNSESDDDEFRQSKMVLGSRPPGCQNKCLNCRPCIATLVIPVHKTKRFSLSSHGEEDDSYYLLSWKCRCGNKLFQP